jgi:heme-degrading monooxygenase HmoA
MDTEATPPEARIRADAPIVTLLTVFTVDPASQDELVERWKQATDDVMRHRPGFISASIHRSFVGTKVINYAQWESRDAFAGMFQDPESSAQLTRLAEIGTPDPALCEVVSVHLAS